MYLIQSFAHVTKADSFSEQFLNVQNVEGYTMLFQQTLTGKTLKPNQVQPETFIFKHGNDPHRPERKLWEFQK
jgi:hypothetical protein